MLRRPSPLTRGKVPVSFLIEDPARILVLSRASRAKDLSSLIYTRKIRNRRNLCRISHLHFSNLYKSPAFVIMFCSSTSPNPWPGLARFRARFSYLCSSVFICGFKGSTHPQPKAKSRRTLIYGNGINSSRKLLKTKDRHHA